MKFYTKDNMIKEILKQFNLDFELRNKLTNAIYLMDNYYSRDILKHIVYQFGFKKYKYGKNIWIKE